MSLTVSSLTQTHSATVLPTSVFLDPNTSYAFCAYPIEGSYGFLPRVLFYATLIFALFARGHLWLTAGALAAALTYSGTAAFHAILLIWRGPAAGALEIDALMAILSTACLISVPLLNWSSTLRKLGATARDLKEGPLSEARLQDDAKSVDYEKESRDASEYGTRTVVIYWALLVTVAFLTVYVVEEGLVNNRTFFPVPVDVSRVQCFIAPNANISVVDQDYVTRNNCTQPCSLVEKSQLLRPLSDLVLLNDEQINRFFEGGIGNEAVVIDGYYRISVWVFPYIILQGAWTVCLGRRSPGQVRDKLWIELESLPKRIPVNWPKTRTVLRELIRFYCGFVYLGAWFVVIICAPGVIFNIVVMELNLAALDLEMEEPYRIGQWGPWCSTGLFLLAALIGKYHAQVVENLSQILRGPNQDRISATEKGHSSAIQPRSRTEDSPWNIFRQSRKNSQKRFQEEWKNFFDWCKNPEAVSQSTPRHPKVSKPGPEISSVQPITPASYARLWPAYEGNNGSTQANVEERDHSQQHPVTTAAQAEIPPAQRPQRKPLPSPQSPPVTASTRLLE